MWQRHRVMIAGVVLVFSALLVGAQGLAPAAAPRVNGSDEAKTTRHPASRPAEAASQNERSSAGVRQRSTTTRPTRPPTTRSTTRPATRPASSRPAAEGPPVVIAYYFHRTLRCPTCLHIEATAKQVIQDRFAGELDAGLLRVESVDIQKQGNEHFAEDYELGSPSLVLVRMVNGQRASWKNCAKVWELDQTEAAFAEYVQGEVAGMLSGQSATASQPAAPDK
jgi:hypothetical protein